MYKFASRASMVFCSCRAVPWGSTSAPSLWGRARPQGWLLARHRRFSKGAGHPANEHLARQVSFEAMHGSGERMACRGNRTAVSHRQALGQECRGHRPHPCFLVALSFPKGSRSEGAQASFRSRVSGAHENGLHQRPAGARWLAHKHRGKPPHVGGEKNLRSGGTGYRNRQPPRVRQRVFASFCLMFTWEAGP